MMDSIFTRLDKFDLADVPKNRPNIFDFELDMQGEKVGGVLNKERIEPFDTDYYIYIKQFNCPVCERSFEAKLIKESKLRVLSVEPDLHPICQPIDPNYYDVIICHKCGYTAAKGFFSNIAGRQADMILADITPKFVAPDYPDQLDVDMAIERYELALLNSLVKNGRDGEKAYYCMKLMWFYRIKGDIDNQKLFAELTLKGFSGALIKDDLPIMGLHIDTITYLLGALYTLLGDKKSALRFLSDVVVSKTASDRLKDRARSIKDQMKE